MLAFADQRGAGEDDGQHGDAGNDLHHGPKPGLLQLGVEAHAQGKVDRGRRRCPISLDESVHLAGQDGLDIAAAGECLAHPGGIDVELHRWAASGKHIALEIRRNGEGECVETPVHPCIHLRLRNDHRRKEMWWVEGVDDAHGKRRAILVDDGDGCLVQRFGHRRRRRVDRESEGVDDQNDHHRVTQQAAQFLDTEVQDLMQKAEEADGREEGAEQGLPEELARREKLKNKLQEARERLEERAKARAQAEREEYERKSTDREGRSGSSKGKKIKPPQEEPRPDEQANLVDADSRLMRKSKREGYEQAYNSQAVVDAEGSQLVLATRVSQCASDSNELVANVKMVPESIGKVAVVLADSGYANGAEVDQLQQRSAEDKIEVYVAVSAEDRRRYDYRPERKEDKPVKNICAPWKLQMKEKIETETGRALYSRRKQTVEPVFGVIKAAMGFRQFLLRGIDKVRGEWQLVTMAYNFKRLWNLKILAERG